jgi:hypothetical protein
MKYYAPTAKVSISVHNLGTTYGPEKKMVKLLQKVYQRRKHDSAKKQLSTCKG